MLQLSVFRRCNLNADELYKIQRIHCKTRTNFNRFAFTVDTATNIIVANQASLSHYSAYAIARYSHSFPIIVRRLKGVAYYAHGGLVPLGVPDRYASAA